MRLNMFMNTFPPQNSSPSILTDNGANKPLASGNSANLDFLRTFAVLLVVARHLLGAFRIEDSRWIHPQAIGIFGVLLFFVHTSLVLMFSLERQLKRTSNKHFYKTFLVRRIFRIYPLSIFVVSLLAFGSILWPVTVSSPYPLTYSPKLVGLLSNILLIQDFMHQPNSIGPLWSLPIEMQMYFVLPILFLNTKKLGVSGMLWLWGGAVILALVQWKYPFLPGLLEFVPCFLPGILCYMLSRQTPTLPFWLFPILLFSLLAVYEISYGLYHHGQAFLGMPACLLLGFLLPRFQEMPVKFFRGVCEIIARYSYGIYLLHTIFIWLAFTYLRFTPLLVQCSVFILGLVLGPALVYYSIEQPMIRFGNKLVGYLHKSRLTP